MSTITIRKKNRELKGEISLPSSKSMSNRALILHHLHPSKITISNLSEAEDTKLLSRLLKSVAEHRHSEPPLQIHCQNAGTVFRFLTACLSLQPGRWLLTGSERMKERPIGPLVDGLNHLGALVRYENEPGYPPLYIEGKKIRGGNTELDSSISSQFVSSLLLIAPALENGLTIRLTGNIVSGPYIRMTLEMLNMCGIHSEVEEKKISIRQQELMNTNIKIEPDWTSASYWYEMAALSDKADLILTGLDKQSIQGDSVLPEIFESLGVKSMYINEGVRLARTDKRCSHFQFDFSNHPDLAQSIAVTCAALNIPAVLTGLQSLKIKETDRISALVSELTRCGFKVKEEGNSAIKIENTEPKTRNPERIQTYGDHRMAMAFAPLALVFGTIDIENPEVVQKSYPGFWNDLKKTGFNY